MKRIIAFAALAIGPAALTSVPAMAESDIACSTAPQSQWKPQADLEAMLTTQGLKVLQVKVENGCYEVYATDKDGKKVNAAYNAETLEQVGDAEAGEN